MTPSFPVPDWSLRWLFLSSVIAAFGYVAFSLAGGWLEVVSSIGQIGIPVTLGALVLSLANYFLRFLRWNSYLEILGYRLKFLRHFQVYLSGFALTATPGKAGEALRCILLEPLGVRYLHSLAALLSERISDVTAVLILSSLFVVAHQDFYAIGLLFVLICVVLVVLMQKSSQQFILKFSEKRSGRFAGFLKQFLGVFEQSRLCNPPFLVFIGLGAGILAWGAEGVAFWLMLDQVGADVSWYMAISIYCLSMLVGAASFMPGGLGGAEAAMTAMLSMVGVPLPAAIAVTLLIRLTTLWFAIAIGTIVTLPFIKQGKSESGVKAD